MFSRVIQSAGEKLKKREKTIYDYKFEQQMELFDVTKKQCDEIVLKIESVLQPDPTIRARGILQSDSLSKYEHLAQVLSGSSHKFENEPLKTTLDFMGQAELDIGAEERSFIGKTEFYVLGTINSFREDDYRLFMKERTKLTQRRRDMDVIKNKVRSSRAKADLSTNEAKLEEATVMFESQAEVVKGLLDNIPSHQDTIRIQLRDFIKAQLAFHQSATHLLQKCLSATPS